MDGRILDATNRGRSAFWLCFRHPPLAKPPSHADAARTGAYPSSGPVTTPGVKWTFKAAGPIVTSPAISGGVVYIGSMSGHLYAIDQQTGKEKWNFKSRMPIASSAAVV